MSFASLALATLAAPVREHFESRLEPVKGEIQRFFLRFRLQLGSLPLQIEAVLGICILRSSFRAQGVRQ